MGEGLTQSTTTKGVPFPGEGRFRNLHAPTTTGLRLSSKTKQRQRNWLNEWSPQSWPGILGCPLLNALSEMDRLTALGRVCSLVRGF